MTEAQSISELLHNSFTEYKRLYTEQGFRATTLSTLEVEKRIENNIVWVALHKELIVGTISIVPNGDGIFIKSLAVAPTARRKGVGREMMRQAEKIATKRVAEYLELTTTPFLYDAIRLYELLNFKRSGYDDLYGTPLIRMTKTLNQTSVSPGETMHSNHVA